MKKLIKSILSVFLMGIFSVSCGSGGVGGSGITASGGIGGTGVSQGTVEGFGSVIVNGVHFDASASTFTIDDDAPKVGDEQALLAKGMQVKVTVGDDGITASNITFDPELEGSVENIDLTMNSFVMLGKTVIVDDSTNFEGTTGLDALSATDNLEISGLTFGDDKIQATHIRKVSFTSEVELKGTVKLAAIDTNTFSIGGQTVNYSDSPSPFIDGMKEADLLSDPFVEVKGTLSGSTLNATTIKRDDDSLGTQVANVQIEALVTAVPMPVDPLTKVGAFSMGSQSITTSALTIIEDGAPDDILKDVRLEVEGTITDGVLIAKKVKFHGNRVKIHGFVQDVSPTANPATIMLLDQVVVINAATRLSDASGGTLTVSGIDKTGDWLEIRGFVTVTGEGATTVTATRVERRNPDPGKSILQAPVDTGSIADPIFDLLGVTVDTTSVGVNGFEDLTGNPIDRADFFTQVKDGTLVKAKGTFDSALGTITASEVELED